MSQLQVEARPYGPDSTPLEVAALKARIFLHPGASDIIVWQDIDNTNVTSMGGSYLYVGLAEACHDRAIFTQTIPGEVTGWSAADRLATSY